MPAMMAIAPVARWEIVRLSMPPRACAVAL
jgi:hypothetical protein